ncbi:MAG: NAD(P)-dependent alcohol dehydrogenase [Actinomycetota bacterium]
MKAIVQDEYGSADVLRFEDIPVPVPGDNEVLLRVEAASAHIGDWHLMMGTPYAIRLGYGLRRPKLRVRGMDVAGRVEAVGKDVTEFQPGDEVFGTCKGSLAEYAVARPDKIALRPSNLTFEQAATVPISGIAALQGLRASGKAQPGQTVLIVGAAGAVGTFAVQLAKALGTEVTGVCSTSKLDLVRSIGADHVIDYTREDFTVSGRRYDLILDLAGRRPVSALRRALSPRGTLVIVGGEGGGRWFGGVMGRLLHVLLLSPFVRQKLRPLASKERKKDLLALKELIEAGKVTPVIGRTYTLSEAPDALGHLGGGHATGKAVITV